MLHHFMRMRGKDYVAALQAAQTRKSTGSVSFRSLVEITTSSTRKSVTGKVQHDLAAREGDQEPGEFNGPADFDIVAELIDGVEFEDYDDDLE